ncbi:MAG: hypothetical protein HGA47_05580 [Zoogloea sp.]|nr:hypothetical protein [Zoogloea sp.]
MQNLSRLVWWLESRSMLWQGSIIVAAFLMAYFLMAVLIYATTWGNPMVNSGVENSRHFDELLAFLFFGDHDGTEIQKYWGLVNKIVFSVLTAAISSAFTFKAIAGGGKLRFSRSLRYYDRDTIRREKGGEYECLVFRVLNGAETDLFDVKVSVTLRYLYEDEHDRTYQHYRCPVLNAELPLLMPRMPFRIYVPMDSIRSAIYDRKLSWAPGGKDCISIQEIKRTVLADPEKAGENKLIVFVTATDSRRGNSVSASMHYPLDAVLCGRFANLNVKEYAALHWRHQLDALELGEEAAA